MGDTMAPHRGAVVITGASTGIGRATALLLDQAGYTVFAGVRKAQDGARLCSEASIRLCPLTLDITDEAQIEAARTVTRDRLGPDRGLIGLINNAGSAEAGPIEVIAISRLRRQMEVNLIGHVLVIQAFLPLIRQGHGRIINVGSAAADCPMPFLGAYAASKSAMRSMSTALRRELRWSRIPVSLIQAGIVSSDIWRDADTQLEAIRREDTQDRYTEPMEALYHCLQFSLRLAVPPTVIATTIKKALEARRPRSVYRSGPGAYLAVIGGLLPDALLDRLLERFAARGRGPAHQKATWSGRG